MHFRGSKGCKIDEFLLNLSASCKTNTQFSSNAPNSFKFSNQSNLTKILFLLLYLQIKTFFPTLYAETAFFSPTNSTHLNKRNLHLPPAFLQVLPNSYIQTRKTFPNSNLHDKSLLGDKCFHSIFSTAKIRRLYLDKETFLISITYIERVTSTLSTHKFYQSISLYSSSRKQREVAKVYFYVILFDGNGETINLVGNTF